MKSHTREARGCGQFFLFTEATNIPKEFQGNFLKQNRNKCRYFWQVSCLYIENTQEEADTKIIVHFKHCLVDVFRNIVVKTVDTNVKTLLLAYQSLLNSPYEIEVDFNFGKDRFYKINDICPRITPWQ